MLPHRPLTYTSARSAGSTPWPPFRGSKTLIRKHFVCCGLLLAALGCDEETGASCKADTECERGAICVDGACGVKECTQRAQCSTGQTCLADMLQCSARECLGDRLGEPLVCPGDRPVCVEESAYQGSCVGADRDMGPGVDMQLPIPVEDMGGADVPAAGDGGDMSVEPPADMRVNPPPAAGLCAPCNGIADCEMLGEGAQCTPIGANGAFCTSGCEDNEDCPSNYECQTALNPPQCIPVNFDCTVECLTTPCPAGEICDLNSRSCAPLREACGACAGEEQCAEGLSCGALGNSSYCFSACEGGVCGQAGFECQEGLCKPAGGVCDPCGGTCGGATPFCDPNTGGCAECGPGHPCGPNMRCGDEGTCEEGGCRNDEDCGNGVCFQAECVDCLADSDCPARNACTGEFNCEPALCRGVLCQNPSLCNEDTGRCDPGCNADADCGADNLSCNMETGQCFYTGFPLATPCDFDSSAGVCPPGSDCVPFFLPGALPMSQGVCSCEKENPADPNSPDRIPCHPGTVCFQLAPMEGMPAAPGVCTGSL